MATFVISNLDAQNFAFENISFEKLSFSSDMERQWRDEHYATFEAVADDSLKVIPIITANGLVGFIHDICLLLSLAQSRVVYCREYDIGGMGRLRSALPAIQSTGDKLVQDVNIERYLNAAVQTLRRPEYTKETGFTPAAYYRLAGINAEVVEVRFMLAWIAMETLANTYAELNRISSILPSKKFEVIKKSLVEALSQVEGAIVCGAQRDLIIQKVSGLNRPAIRYLIKSISDAYGWDFITDQLLGDYIKVRNAIMHSGAYGRVGRTRIADLTERLATSVQLALIDLLGCSKYVHDLLALKNKVRAGNYDV